MGLFIITAFAAIPAEFQAAYLQLVIISTHSGSSKRCFKAKVHLAKVDYLRQRSYNF